MKKEDENNRWSRILLQELSVLKISNGIFNDPQKVGKGCKLVNVVNLYTDPYIDTKHLNLLDVSQSEFKKFKLQVGDLLFTRSSLKLEGIAHCNMYISRNVNAVFECHTMRIRPNEKIVMPRYLYHYCRSYDARRHFMKKAQTTTMTTINQGDLASLPVLLPPLPEQKSIASILETWDTAIEKTERLIAAKEKHFKWLLKTLISDQQNNPDWKKINLGDILRYEQPTKYIVRTTKEGLI